MKRTFGFTGNREYRSRIVALLLSLILALGQVQPVAAFAAENTAAGDVGDETFAEIEEAVSADEAADTATDAVDEVKEEAPSEEDSLTDERAGAAAVSMNFVNGMAQPILKDLSVSNDAANQPDYTDYKNKRDGSVQRFTVYVETDLDTDMDGMNDLVMALVQVPTAAVSGNYKAPVIFEASPYYGGETENMPVEKFSKYFRPNEGEIFEWNREAPSVSEDMIYQKGTSRTPSGNAISTMEHANRQDYTCDDWYFNYARYFKEPVADMNVIAPGFIAEYDYYLARGFAVVLSAGLGTRGSEGFETCGSVAEARAFASIVEWIHGDRRAYTDKEHNIEIKASDWATGETAMEGLSYDGTLAYEVAALNPKGLVTVVPESGIADWYDYTNSQGVCKYGNGVTAQYDYTTHLASTNSSRFYELLIDIFMNKSEVDKESKIYKLYKLYEKVLTTFSDDQYSLKGHYGPHWQGRDFYTDYRDGKIETPALIVAGLQDYNVINKHAQLMSEAFSVRRVLLHLGAHDTPNNMVIWTGKEYRSYKDILNLWYSHFLCGQENGILEELPKVLAQDNADGQFKGYPYWNKIGSENWGNKKFVIEPSDRLEHKLISSNNAKAVDDDEILDPHEEELDKIRYYNIDDYYEELGMDYVSPLGAAADAAVAQGKLLNWSKYADSDMTINGAGEVHLRIKTDKVSDENCQQPVVGAMLYDVSNEYFDAYELNNENKLPTMIVQKNVYDYGADIGSYDQQEYMTSSVKKHFISKGCLNLLDPQAGYYPASSAPSTNKIKADTYYDYVIYLNPTFYTVKEGHTLVLYLYPKGGGIDSNSDFTVDNSQSFAYIPLNTEIKQGGVSIDAVYTEDDYGNACLSENLILPDGKREKVSTVKTEGVTLYSETDRNLWVRVDDVSVQDGRMTWIYQGEALTLNPDTIHVYDGTKVLSSGQDYTIAYKNNKKVSDKAELIIKFKGSYKGNKQISYPMSIQKASLDSKNDVSINSVVTAATGKALKPVPEMFYPYTGISIASGEVKITYSSKTDKSIDHVNSVKEAGEYTINIEPKNAKGNLQGKAAVDLTVLGSTDQGKLISNAAVEFVDHSNKKYVYENKAIIPKLSVTLQGVNEGKPLTEGVHYTERAYRNREPGTARVVITAVSGNSLGIRGSKALTFKITNGRELKDAEGSGFTFTVYDAPYSASGAKGKVYVEDGETYLTAGTDYTVKYSKNKAVSGKEKAVATIRGKGKYKGTVTKEYVILPMDLNRLYVSVADKFGDSEDGYKNPVVTVTDLNGKKLKLKRDYSVGLPEKDPTDNTKTTYKIAVSGEGNYAGTVSSFYRYMPKSADLSKVKANKIPAQLLTGNDVRIPWSVQENLLYTGTSKDQTPLGLNTDYEIYDYIKNDRAGTAKVVYRGIGKYAGKKTVSFKIKDGRKNRGFLGWLMDNVLRKG